MKECNRINTYLDNIRQLLQGEVKAGQDNADVSSIVKIEYETQILTERYDSNTEEFETCKKEYKQVSLEWLEIEDFL